jgi:Transposase IS4
MIRLKLVKTAQEEASNQEETSSLPHGAQVLKDLVMLWANSDQIVCVDSYFASVAAAFLELKKIGLRFIGVVKTARTRRFPMAYLQGLELQKRGDRKGLIMRGGSGPLLLAFVWMDRDHHRYFIASASSLQEGASYNRLRWRQLEQGALPEKVELEVPQPQAAEIYYDTCGRIDQSNRHRQATLKLEHKFKVHDWSDRVNHSILGMAIVDTWLVKKTKGHSMSILHWR